MARTDNLTNFLTDVADSIREKKGTSEPILASNFDTEIDSIEGGSSKYAPRRITFENYAGTELDYEIENLDTSNMTSLNSLFYSCTKLKNIEKIKELDTSKITDFSKMLAYCTGMENIDLSGLNMSNATDLTELFLYCTYAKNINVKGIDTSKVDKMSSIFNGCQNIQTIDVSEWDTSNTTTMRSMFMMCTQLTDLDISNFSFDKVTDIYYFFSYCYQLTNLKFGQNLGKGYTQQRANWQNYQLELQNSTNITHDSLMSIINNLYDLNLTYNVANGGTLYTQQLVLGQTNLAKLTAEEIAIATNKGWVVS